MKYVLFMDLYVLDSGMILQRVSLSINPLSPPPPSLPPGQSVDISSSEISVHTVAALLKDILRSVPGGILLSSRYTEFVATNDIKDVGHRVHNIQKYVYTSVP